MSALRVAAPAVQVAAPRALPDEAPRHGFQIRRPAAGSMVMPCPECGQMLGLASMRWLVGPPMRIGCAVCAAGSGSVR